MKKINWTSTGGKTQRQIDYLMVNQKYRNAIRKAQIIPGWQANMAQQQHGVVQMDICLKLMKTTKITRETGKRIKYDIQELRQEPQKIARWFARRETPPEPNNQETTQQIWEKVRKTLPRTSTKLSHKKHPQNQLPPWAQKAQQWSTPGEWEEFQQQIERRQKLQRNPRTRQSGQEANQTNSIIQNITSMETSNKIPEITNT